MKYKNFEDFLQTQHAENYIGSLDDMPEEFVKWLGDLDLNIITLYAGAYGEIKKLEGFDLATN